MVLSESANFALGAGLFLRSVFKAGVTYVNENKATPVEKIKGTGLKEQLPKDLPTIIDIKRALPKHCFQPKLSTSLYYMAKDLILAAIFFFLFKAIHTAFPSPFIYWPTMVLYWAIQGTIFTAIFVVGHDCGHGSFSNSSTINDICGNIMHAFLFTPFYMWKLSHRHHHKYTCNIDKDEVFYPVRESNPDAHNATLPGFGFGIGWYGYLISGYKPRPVYHFNPWDKMFKGHVVQCFLSLAALATMTYLLRLLYLAEGWTGLFCYYIMPDFIFACFMVIITFLHHSEMNIPWYADDQWDFVRGQLSTIDRHYGIVHEVIHNIGTHQMHHMFAHIPHYYLEDATAAFRKAFPHLVKICDEPILPSFVRMFLKYDKQNVLKDDVQVHYYQ
jgi:omega-3 fatty acid desaturase (delta-15 desaturase)